MHHYLPLSMQCEHIAITQELNLLLDDAKAQIVELIHQKELTEVSTQAYLVQDNYYVRYTCRNS